MTNNEDQTQLKLISNCPVCGSRYSDASKASLGQDSETILDHFSCGKCESSALVLSLNKSPHQAAFGVITDLNAADVSRFSKSASIGINDVINVHEYFGSDRFKDLIDLPVPAVKRRLPAKSAKKSTK